MLNDLKVYVVSLKNESERRLCIEKQLREINLDFVFFDAIDVKKNSDLMSLYDEGLSLKINKRGLTNGEIGCALSHQLIYKDIINKKTKYALILEDDAILENDISKVIEDIISIKPDVWDVILLGYSKVSKLELKRLDKINPIFSSIYNKKYKVGQVWRNSTSGTVGYLINNAGVKKILSKGVSASSLADNWLYFGKEFNANIYHCRPFLVYENFENFTSSIDKERSIYDRKPLKLELLRLVRGKSILLLVKYFPSLISVFK